MISHLYLLATLVSTASGMAVVASRPAVQAAGLRPATEPVMQSVMGNMRGATRKQYAAAFEALMENKALLDQVALEKAMTGRDDEPSPSKDRQLTPATSPVKDNYWSSSAYQGSSIMHTVQHHATSVMNYCDRRAGNVRAAQDAHMKRMADYAQQRRTAQLLRMS